MRKGLGVVLVGVILGCGGFGAPDLGDCPEYIACTEGLGMPTATLEASYGEGGLCWQEEDHELCRAACSDGLEMSCPDQTPQEADCGSLESTGNSEGDVAVDFQVPTQSGEPFQLHAHCDKVVLVVTSAIWEPATADEVDDLEALYQAKKDEGLMVVLLLAENNDGQTPSQDELKAYADTHGASFPVGADANFEIEGRFAKDNGIPSFTLIDRGAVIHAADDYFARDAIDGLL